jgi:hypothetical protein
MGLMITRNLHELLRQGFRATRCFLWDRRMSMSVSLITTEDSYLWGSESNPDAETNIQNTAHCLNIGFKKYDVTY